MFHFYTPRKHLRFSDVFRGYRSGTLVESGLTNALLSLATMVTATESGIIYVLFFKFRKVPCDN